MMRSRAQSAEMPRRYPPGVARLAMPLLGAALCLSTASCVADRYAGIDLRPGAAPAEVQELAFRGQSGDKQAQLDLGILFEEGRGVARDFKQARSLYQKAAADSGGTLWIYTPPVGNGTSGQVISVNRGHKQKGLAEARRRLKAVE